MNNSPKLPTYQPENFEQKWYDYWMKNNVFHSQPDSKPAHCIIMPPPNVTGVLHMGHVLNNTLQDVLIRRARMQGKNACWVPGLDHASIATENKIVAMLKSQGKDKKMVGRKKFMELAWQWKDKYGNIIMEQLKKIGASCDWKRTCFTLDSKAYDSVVKVFIDLYRKGDIYKRLKMIHWDVQAATALSDIEIYHKKVKQPLYYIRYKASFSPTDYLTVATVRPETIMADQALCVHPDDKRYQHWIGKRVEIPLIKRAIPVIADPYVDIDFATGCLKITPAHDINDYQLGLKHKLAVLNILDSKGHLNKEAKILIGKDRFKARKEIVNLLEKEGFLEKKEIIESNVSYSERTHTVVEPRLSLQWFCNMDSMVKPAIDCIKNNDIALIPNRFEKSYLNWLENIKDWCISRQLWWGHRIPAWYGPEDNMVVAINAQEALELMREKTKNPLIEAKDIRQDEDVLDTWFSSWLWPFTVFNGILDKNNQEFKYYYPSAELVTAPDILFFWVARMIFSGYQYAGKPPFRKIYLTGIIRDEQGRKMSKSLGNSPEPLKLIEKYGADALRMGALLASPAGNDLKFDEKLCIQGRNFCNKLWNAFRLIKGWQVLGKREEDKSIHLACQAFQGTISSTIKQVESSMSNYRISETLMLLYKLTWDDFCSWYLEIIKPKDGTIRKDTYDKTLVFFEQLLRLLHPFIPFITEALWQDAIYKRKEGSSIALATYPNSKGVDIEKTDTFDYLKAFIVGIRKFRNDRQIALKKPLKVYFQTAPSFDPEVVLPILKKMAFIDTFQALENPKDSFVEMYVHPVKYYIDCPQDYNNKEIVEGWKREYSHLQKFLVSIENKLSNKKFLAHAHPDIVKKEMKKRDDTKDKIQQLKQSIDKNK